MKNNNRRNFLKTGAMLGGSLIAAPLIGLMKPLQKIIQILIIQAWQPRNAFWGKGNIA